MAYLIYKYSYINYTFIIYNYIYLCIINIIFSCYMFIREMVHYASYTANPEVNLVEFYRKSHGYLKADSTLKQSQWITADCLDERWIHLMAKSHCWQFFTLVPYSTALSHKLCTPAKRNNHWNAAWVKTEFSPAFGMKLPMPNYRIKPLRIQAPARDCRE